MTSGGSESVAGSNFKSARRKQLEFSAAVANLKLPEIEVHFQLLAAHIPVKGIQVFHTSDHTTT